MNFVTGWMLPDLLTRKFNVVVPGLFPKQYAMDGCSKDIQGNVLSTGPVIIKETSLKASCWNLARSVLLL